MSSRTLAAVQPASFAFNAENMARADRIIAKYPKGRQDSAVIPLLDLAQRQDGWVSRPAIEAVAKKLDMAVMRVLEVATFYTMFNLHPMGRNHIQVCTNLSCWLRGSDDVVRACKSKLGIGLGDGQAFDVVATAREQADHACQDTRLVGDQDGDGMGDHRGVLAHTSAMPSSDSLPALSSGPSSISLCAAPEGIIGKQFSF